MLAQLSAKALSRHAASLPRAAVKLLAYQPTYHSICYPLADDGPRFPDPNAPSLFRRLPWLVRHSSNATIKGLAWIIHELRRENAAKLVDARRAQSLKG